MNKQQFLEWYNTKVWNLPKDFPRPSQRLVHCECGKSECIGKHPCKGWKFDVGKLPEGTKPNGVVYAIIVPKEQPTWQSMFANRNRQNRSQNRSVKPTSATSVSAPIRSSMKKAG